MNEPSSIFVSPPPIPNIESLFQSTILSLYSESLSRNRADVNIQQQTTLEVSNKETVIYDNEDLDTPQPQDILIFFATEDLSSFSSSDIHKYKHAWRKAKLIHYSVLSAGEFPDTFSRELYIALNHK